MTIICDTIIIITPVAEVFVLQIQVNDYSKRKRYITKKCGGIMTDL